MNCSDTDMMLNKVHELDIKVLELQEHINKKEIIINQLKLDNLAFQNELKRLQDFNQNLLNQNSDIQKINIELLNKLINKIG